MARASAASNTLFDPRKSTTTISFPRPFILVKDRVGAPLMRHIWQGLGKCHGGGESLVFRAGSLTSCGSEQFR